MPLIGIFSIERNPASVTTDAIGCIRMVSFLRLDALFTMRNYLSILLLAAGLVAVAWLGYACVTSGVVSGGDGAYPLGEYGSP